MTASGGSGGSAPAGEPYVFVGSTDGMLRVFKMDVSDGSLSAAGSIDAGSGLDFVTLGPDERSVFVAKDGSVEAYAYDPNAESLTLLDSAPTNGGGTHVAVDPSGKVVLVAHYTENALSLLTYGAASGFGVAQLFQPGMNAHQVRFDQSGTRVYVPCLGSNQVAEYDLDPDAGTLTAKTPASVAAAGGPRHLDFQPDGTLAYVLAELGSQIHTFDVGGNGSLQARAGGSLFTAEDEQGHSSSDIHVTPDGKFVYAVNRNPPEIVRFQVGSTGLLTRLGADGLSGVVREFAMDPAG
ncbi:MAG TPA: beta-propeller fold lactonase family protein, partial [Polyangiaceae bacterium]|nr:beta-propeller fold lactonase family protein [Polyangiaceae bacterium]